MLIRTFCETDVERMGGKDMRHVVLGKEKDRRRTGSGTYRSIQNSGSEITVQIAFDAVALARVHIRIGELTA